MSDKDKLTIANMELMAMAAAAQIYCHLRSKIPDKQLVGAGRYDLLRGARVMAATEAWALVNAVLTVTAPPDKPSPSETSPP